MTNQLTQIANDLEIKMLRIDEALGSMNKEHPKFVEYSTAADELDVAIADIRSAIRHIHNSAVDKVIWDLDNQMLRG